MLASGTGDRFPYVLSITSGEQFAFSVGYSGTDYNSFFSFKGK